MLVFGNNLYISGACLSAYTHRQFINKNNLDIELVIMVDENVYKYKKELEKYFDRVIKIDLFEVKLNNKYYVIEKYSKWMKYSINKWQILNIKGYEKILFLDIDILPLNERFYDVFKNRTPSFMIKGQSYNNTEIKDYYVSKDLDFNIEKCYKFSEKLFKSIDASFVLLKPDEKLYNEYFDFIKKCAGDTGYISMTHSGVDETSLLIFYLFYKKITCYSISYEFAVVPWEKKYRYDKNKVMGINYVAAIKPWTLLPMFQWGEQLIWHKIAKKALEKDSIITDFYTYYLLETLKNFIKEQSSSVNKKGENIYNIEGVSREKNIFERIQKIIQNKEIEQLDYSDKKEIMDLSKEIHKYMDKKSLLDMSKLEKLLE